MPKRIEAGKFLLASGMLHVSDPCYEDTGAGYTITDAKKGWWQVYYTNDSNGVGPASIEVVHDSFDAAAADYSFDTSIPVDSGQAGVFDYEEYAAVPGELYETICGRPKPVDTLPFGMVSSTYSGDGEYHVDTAYDGAGSVIAVRVTFFDEFEESPEEEESWGGWDDEEEESAPP